MSMSLLPKTRTAAIHDSNGFCFQSFHNWWGRSYNQRNIFPKISFFKWLVSCMGIKEEGEHQVRISQKLVIAMSLLYSYQLLTRLPACVLKNTAQTQGRFFLLLRVFYANNFRQACHTRRSSLLYQRCCDCVCTGRESQCVLRRNQLDYPSQRQGVPRNSF